MSRARARRRRSWPSSRPRDEGLAAAWARTAAVALRHTYRHGRSPPFGGAAHGRVPTAPSRRTNGLVTRRSSYAFGVLWETGAGRAIRVSYVASNAKSRAALRKRGAPGSSL